MWGSPYVLMKERELTSRLIRTRGKHAFPRRLLNGIEFTLMNELCFQEFARRASVYGFVDVGRHHLVMNEGRSKESRQQESLADKIFKRYPPLQGLKAKDRES